MSLVIHGIVPGVLAFQSSAMVDGHIASNIAGNTGNRSWRGHVPHVLSWTNGKAMTSMWVEARHIGHVRSHVPTVGQCSKQVIKMPLEELYGITHTMHKLHTD